MQRVGPFYSRYPTATVGMDAWAWCYLWVDHRANVRMIEWL